MLQDAPPPVVAPAALPEIVVTAARLPPAAADAAWPRQTVCTSGRTYCIVS